MATHLPVIGGHAEGFGKTARTDGWWQGPAITFFVFSTFVVYTTWAALQGNHYYADPYLSPFYSPVLFDRPDRARRRAARARRGSARGRAGGRTAVPVSPAILILVFPGSFRFTCYYYRKAYYRSFAGSPPGCAVGPLAGKRKYRGETALLLIQNLHRYALYFALIFIVLLGKDAVESFFQRRPVRHRRRQHHPDDQRRPDRELHVRLPLVPPPDRRPQGLHVRLRQADARARRVEEGDLVQRAPHAVRVGEPASG